MSAPQPRQLHKHFAVRVHTDKDTGMQRILVSHPGDRRAGTNWLTVVDAQFFVGQLQRAIKRAPRAR